MTEPAPDPGIPPDELAFRRVPNVKSADFVVVDEGTRRRRPSSGAFKPDSDGISVYLHSDLEKEELGPQDLLKDPEINGVASVTVGAVREVELDVAKDPWPVITDDPEHSRNAAHALIVGFQGLSNGQRKKLQQRLAKKAVMTIDPSG